jgi:hypothetical protein
VSGVGGGRGGGGGGGGGGGSGFKNRLLHVLHLTILGLSTP